MTFFNKLAPRAISVSIRILIIIGFGWIIISGVLNIAADLEYLLGGWALPTSIAIVITVVAVLYFIMFAMRKREAPAGGGSKPIDVPPVHTIVVVIGDDGFPAAYEYCGVSDSGAPQWLGVLMDRPEPLEQWPSDRILGVYSPVA